MSSTDRPGRRTQQQRRTATQDALLEAAARGLSRHGYGSLNLERVAREAGYTRGALYHLFPGGKAELALAVVRWVERTWYEEVAGAMAGAEPADALRAVARAHAVYCRRDVARVMTTLRVEFAGQDHPVADAVHGAAARVVADCAALVEAAQAAGTARADVPPRVLALAVVGALEGLVINLAGQAPADEVLAERAVDGLLAVPP